MELTDARKSALMAYCRIDDLTAEDEILLKREFHKAIAYLAGAGVSVPAEGTARLEQFDAIVDALVLDAWDNRGTQTAGYTLAENPAFRRDLNQLKQTEPVSDLDTGTGIF